MVEDSNGRVYQIYAIDSATDPLALLVILTADQAGLPLATC